MRANKRDKDITCVCSAYPEHPHRLGGGNCDGSAWCTSFRAIDSFDCDNCNCNDKGICQVITGQESISSGQCECVTLELNSRYLKDTYGNLPLDIEDYWTKKEQDYREEH